MNFILEYCYEIFYYLQSNIFLSWLSSTIKGIWTKDENAGGSLEDVNNYARNPQYLIEVTEPGFILSVIIFGKYLLLLLQTLNKKLLIEVLI